MKASSERGFTLLELMVSMVLAAVVLVGVLSQYTSSAQNSYDQGIRITTLLQAQATLQMVGSEIRMLGNGVPFDQPNFEIGDLILSDPTKSEPIDVTNTTASRITFRINETGDVYLLTQDFDPSVALTIYLTDVSNLAANDPIYLTNSVVAGDEGLYATIAGVNSGDNSITINANYVTSPGATFPRGSICEEVPVVIYDSAPDGSGITRDSGFGPVSLGARTQMALEYLDFNGNPIALPLTNDAIINQLRSIRVTITQESEKALTTGEFFTATASQVFGIRNLNYLF